MYNNEGYSLIRNDDILENDFENKEDLFDKQHLSDVEMEKLRNVIKTKVAGELIIKLSNLEQTLYLAGQNMTKNTIEKIKKTLEETYHTDEYFLDEIEYILAPYWEELTDDDIALLLIKSFEIFDTEQQGFIDKKYLIQNLTTLGEMPLTMKDIKIMFSMINDSKKSLNTFNYHQFINKLCGLDNNNNKKILNRSAYRKGNATLGGLFPVHEYGNPQEPCGAISEFRGIQRLEAMLFAIEQINNDTNLLPGIELGALILDTCSDDNYAVEQSLGFVISRLTSSSCKCVNTSLSESSHNDNVFGVVGATLSSVSVHVANLLRLFQLPQISYASTAPKLSEASFEYFARTVPSDSNQARAIVDILQRLNFTYVNTIYSHGDYGEGGFREFRRLLKESTITDDDLTIMKKKFTRLCIADEQRLYRDATIQDIKIMLQTMFDRVKSDLQVRVYVLFVTKEDARKLLQAIKLFNGTHRPVLIASDAWGKESSVVINGETDETAVGALTLELVSMQPENFDRYFNSLKPDLPDEIIHKNTHNKNSKIISSRNPWFNEFWEHRFGCSLTTSSTCINHQLNETNWDSKLQFIVDATYVFAHALHEYLNCSLLSCQNISLTDIDGKKLFQLILEKTFIMPDSRQIQFNAERFVPGHYRIYNYRRSNEISSLSDTITSPYEYVSVGEWKIDRNQNGKLNLAIDSIVWPGTNTNDISLSSSSRTIPTSRCSEPCRVGEFHQFQGDSCCWVCTPCNETSIVIDFEDQERCEPCPTGYWPTQNRTSCYKLKETSMEFLSVLTLVPISLSIIGNILTLYVVILFYQKRQTPVVKASGKELCFIMLAGIHLCYLMTFPIIIRPHIITCVIQRLGIGLAFSMMYAALLTKTNRIARIFESTKKQGKLRPEYISPHSQVVICSCLIMVQLLLSLLWLAYERPYVDMIAYERLVILKCHMNKYSFLFSLSYNVLLVLICTMYAVRTRKVPENFNETKFIGFTCYTTCILWLAFLPIYFTAHETGRHHVYIATLCVTISLCATVALACLFSPKVYIILLHPEKNMRLAKQLRAQVNSLKFATQIPAKTSFILNHHNNNNKDIVNDESQSATISSNTEEKSQPLKSNQQIILKTFLNNTKNQNKKILNNKKRKMSTTIITSHSDGCLIDEQQKLSIKQDIDNDVDSLNSDSLQNEQILM
ncbi:unnamed protein product [Rotaria sordida]|uniref:G-protein coupled receptors family 3 profile domain-containing protein n=1 Tax=Rotaria sordida TaxID=392033 RepID=A0A818J047_9BILA|nr:unnamed protein product [Rotaria sordida]